MCVGVSVWLGWSGIRVAGCFSLKHGYRKWGNRLIVIESRALEDKIFNYNQIILE